MKSNINKIAAVLTLAGFGAGAAFAAGSATYCKRESETVFCGGVYKQ